MGAEVSAIFKCGVFSGSCDVGGSPSLSFFFPAFAFGDGSSSFLGGFSFFGGVGFGAGGGISFGGAGFGAGAGASFSGAGFGAGGAFFGGGGSSSFLGGAFFLGAVGMDTRLDGFFVLMASGIRSMRVSGAPFTPAGNRGGGGGTFFFSFLSGLMRRTRPPSPSPLARYRPARHRPSQKQTGCPASYHACRRASPRSSRHRGR